MSDLTAKLDSAMKILISVFEDTKSTEVGDALDTLSEYRAKYVEDNSQFGVGA